MAEWTKQDFDKFYYKRGEPWGYPGSRQPIMVHYHNWSIHQWQRTVFAPKLAQVLGLVSGQAVILVGAGFNATAEGLNALGIRVIGTDLSTYIQNQKAQTEEAEIRDAIIAAGLNPDTDLILGPDGQKTLDPLEHLLRGGRANPQVRGWGQILGEDLRTNGSRNAVIRAFEEQYPSTPIRYIITEEVLNSITDAEAGLVCDYCQGAAQAWGSTVVHMLSPLHTNTTQAPELNWKTYAGWRAWLNTRGYLTQKVLPTVTAINQGMFFPTQEAVYNISFAETGDAYRATKRAAEHVADQQVIEYGGLI